MKYLSTKTYKDTEIDVKSATLDQLLDCYNSLFEMSDDGGAFPGSRAARAAKVYADQLRALVADRPEIEDYRNELIAKARAAKLADTYID